MLCWLYITCNSHRKCASKFKNTKKRCVDRIICLGGNVVFRSFIIYSIALPYFEFKLHFREYFVQFLQKVYVGEEYLWAISSYAIQLSPRSSSCPMALHLVIRLVVEFTISFSSFHLNFRFPTASKSGHGQFKQLKNVDIYECFFFMIYRQSYVKIIYK